MCIQIVCSTPLPVRDVSLGFVAGAQLCFKLFCVKRQLAALFTTDTNPTASFNWWLVVHCTYNNNATHTPHNRLPDAAFSRPSARQLSTTRMLSSIAWLMASISLRRNSCSTYEATSICPSGLPIPVEGGTAHGTTQLSITQHSDSCV